MTNGVRRDWARRQAVLVPAGTPAVTCASRTFVPIPHGIYLNLPSRDVRLNQV
jgi:hypothetical protein